MPEPTVLEHPQRVAEAMLGRDRRPGGVMSPENRARWDAIESIRKQRADNISEQKITESFVPHPPPTEARVRQVNNENLGSKRKGGTGADAGERDYVPGERSEQYRKDADKFAGLSRELLDDGFDGLKTDTVWTADAKRDFLRAELLESMKSWPLSRGVMEGYGPYGNTRADDARNALLDEMLRDPNLLKKLGENFGEIYDGDGAIFEDVLSKAQEEFAKVKAEKDAKEKEIVENTRVFGNVDRKYHDMSPGGITYGKLNSLRVASANWPKDTSTLNAQISALQLEINKNLPQQFSKDKTPQFADPSNPTRITHFKDELNENIGISSKLASLQGEIDLKRAALDDIKQKQDELAALSKEAADVEQTRNELKEKQAKLEGEIGIIDARYQTAEGALNEKKALRMAQEEEHKNKVKGMVREAGRRFLKDEVKRYENAQEKSLQKEAKSAASRDEKAIADGLLGLRRRQQRLGGRETFVVDATKNKEAYQTLVRTGSPETIVKGFMEVNLNQIKTQYGEGSPQYKEELARLKEQYDNPDFMKKMNATVGERILRDFMSTGNKFKKEDINIFVGTDWWQPALDGAFAKNDQASKAMEQLQKNGAFPGGGRSKSEMLGNLMKNPNTYKAGVSLLALLFGAPFLAAGAGLAYGAYAGIGHAAGIPGGPLF